MGQPIIVGGSEEINHAKNGLDGGHLGGTNIPYRVPNQRVEIHMVSEGPPVQPLRSVGGSHNGFVTESLIDELAHEAGRDPLVYRLELLEHNPRLRAVLQLAAERAGWPKTLPKGRGLGIGLADYHTAVAQIAEVRVSDTGVVKIERIVCAVDSGTVVNPSGLRAQVEGGILFGLSPVLLSEITVERGRTQQSNFHDYRVVSMADTPQIDVYVVPSIEPPQGIGEPPVVPVAPAVANAVFAATGRRIRKLPIRPEALKGWRG